MKTNIMDSIRDEDVKTAYELVSMFVGSLRVDTVFFELAHPEY
jgi:hypothetical protein